MATDKKLNDGPLDEGMLRNSSVGAIELGDHRILRLDELTADDRALAEQFGYQPVRLTINQTPVCLGQ
jgi:hypothetical protein